MNYQDSLVLFNLFPVAARDVMQHNTTQQFTETETISRLHHVGVLVRKAGGMYRSTFFILAVAGHCTPGTHCTGGSVGPTTGLNDVEKRKFLPLKKLELRPSAVQPVTSRYTDFIIQTPRYFR
jgi:hypothetical protein